MSDFKLDKHPKIKSGFKPPEGYFDSLSENVMTRISEPEVKVIPFYRVKRNWMMAAAAVLILALMVPFFQDETTLNTTLDDSSIENYLSYQANISQYDLVNLLDSDDFDKIESDLPIADETIEEILISNNNFENYLID